MKDYGNGSLTSTRINLGSDTVILLNCVLTGMVNRAVVLVIDSVNFMTEYRDVAALLYDLLASWHHTQTLLLIACNKQGIKS